MNDTAQSIPPDDRSDGLVLRLRKHVRNALAKSLVRPGPLIVVDIFAKHVIQMAAAKDQQVIKSLPTSTSHPAFRESIRPGRPIRQPDDADAFTAEDFVEGDGKLGVSIAEQNL